MTPPPALDPAHGQLNAVLDIGLTLFHRATGEEEQTVALHLPIHVAVDGTNQDKHLGVHVSFWPN